MALRRRLKRKENNVQKVTREDIASLDEYEVKRPSYRAEIMEIKKKRRIHVGSHLTFLFENTDTMTYQVHEMVRAERLTAEEDIFHELKTYNELLPPQGDLSCTLLIEIEDAISRDITLRNWKDLCEHIYARLVDGRKVHVSYDPRQIGDDRLSSVQYLQIKCGGVAVSALGVDKPGLELETPLSEEQKKALSDDLN
jgi:hypothetical protein